MKKRKKILFSVGAVLGALLLAFGIYVYICTAKYRVSGDVQSVTVSSTFDGPSGPIVTSDPEQIAVLLDCIKKVFSNNWHADHHIMMAPHHYQITFTYKNGETETREYTVYPTKKKKYSNPFKDFYALFEEPESTAITNEGGTQ